MTGGRACAVNPIGTPALAKGGSGDILTGLLTALMNHTAACAEEAPLAELQLACWLHARAAQRAEAAFGTASVSPEDVVRCIRLAET